MLFRSLSSNSNKLKDKKVLLSLYNGKSKLGGFKQQVYSSFEDVNYGLDFEDIKQGEYFLECYYSSNNSGSYQGEIYGTYGIALVVIDSKVCFVTDPTKKQIKQMIKAGGSSESDWIYTTKDGSELVLFAKGSKIYAYRKGKGTVLGLDLVGKIDGRSLGFQVEGLSGVLSYDTSAVSDGTYLLSVYEYQEDTRADQNYKSIAYSDQMLKVQVESGLVARILPPTRQEVAEVADTITDKSKTLYTSYMDSCRFQFYCQENTLYIYDVPQE